MLLCWFLVSSNVPCGQLRTSQATHCLPHCRPLTRLWNVKACLTVCPSACLPDCLCVEDFGMSKRVREDTAEHGSDAELSSTGVC